MVHGDLGDESIGDFERLLIDRVSAGPCTIDLSAVSHFPSSALSAIVNARRAGGPGSLTVRVARDAVARHVLEMTGFPYELV